MIKRIKKYWKFLAILLLLSLLVWTRLGVTAKKSQVKEYKVTKQTFKQSLTLSGKVDATDKVNLHFQTSGRLAWVGVKPGDPVNAYQGVASLDPRDVQAGLQKRLNLYLKTRWDFEQLHDDTKDTILNDKLKRILEKAQFDLNNSVIDVELQHLAVEYATLVSPIAGVVTRVESPVAGVNVSPQEAEIEVVNPTTIYLSVLADQTEVTKLSHNMKADVVFDAYPSEHIEGTIVSIAFSPKQGESGTVYELKVTLVVTNNAYRYRLGMTADASFVTIEKPNTLVVPLALVKQEKNQKYVLKLVNGEQLKTNVTLGEETDTLGEITGGLSDGDLIIAK